MSFHFAANLASKKCIRAFSLAETLITLGLFGALLTIVGQLAVGAFRFQTNSFSNQDSVRQGAIVCDQWARDLRHCEAIVWPKYSDWSKGRTYKYPSGQNAVVVYRLRWGNESASVLVGYRFWAKTGRLERCIYGPKQTISEAALLREDAPSLRKELLPAAKALSVWGCNQKQCGGQAVLGFAFTALPPDAKERGLSAQADLGMQFSSEVQAKGM